MRTRSERRQSARVRIFGDLHGRIVPIDLIVILRDISTGGFAIESPQSFPPGAEYLFELTAPIGRQLVASARLRQCVEQADSDDTLPYLANFVFTDAARRDAGAIEAFVRQFAIVPGTPDRPVG